MAKQKELDLLNTECRENIGKQYRALIPSRNAYPEAQREKIVKEVQNKDRDVFNEAVENTRKATREKKLFAEGANSLLETVDDQWKAAQILATFRYGADHMPYYDLAGGMYSALTDPTGNTVFHDMDTLASVHTGRIVSTRVIVTLDGLYKLALGATVNKNGRAERGAGYIVNEQKKRLKAVFYGDEPEPFAIASINVTNPKTGKIEKTAIHARPLTVQAFRKDAFIISIEHSFFPVEMNKAGKLIATDKYLHFPAGLYTICALGSWLLKNICPEKIKGNVVPNAYSIYQLMLALQGAQEMRTLVPEIHRVQSDDRSEFLLRRNLFKWIYPRVFRGDGSIEWQAASDYVADAGRAYLLAIDHLKINSQLHQISHPCESQQAKQLSRPRFHF